MGLQDSKWHSLANAPIKNPLYLHDILYATEV